ncbi:MAG: tRNA (adenosine(37)-N6)-threonylcarbamoyltransferase complex ATPase subunit type 1 TsaE [Polaromonas sp.]|nr:tRNA (adenosine(37)-N6)-threonylcarbamoyltransferase complex ATPase subunit type 1 TsaE [Polaromonas sp.]
MAIEVHPAIVKSLHWSSEDQTRAFAEALAQQVKKQVHSAGPELNASIHLRGDLGVGKTTFVRYFLKALGVEGRIKSPTYAVVEPYTVNDSDAQPSNTISIWHFDFYRFNDPDEWEEAGFREIFASPGLKLVEWPDKAGQHLPSADLVVAIELTADDERRVSVQALTPAGARLVNA